MQTEIFSMYHDMKKHFLAVAQMNDLREIHDYAESLYGNIAKTEQYYKTGSNMADIVLNDKKQLAQTYGISMEAVIEEGCLAVLKNEDICTIFANALDNALEACKKQKHGQKYIIIKAFEKQSSLIICIRNSIGNPPKKEWNEFVTDKENRFYHGYGIKSIQLAAKKYEGEIHFSNTDTEFTMTLLIRKD